jgi:hypothetical protein
MQRVGDMVDQEHGKGQGALVASVRNTRRLLAIQLIVALLAFIAAGASMFGVMTLDQKRQALIADVQAKSKELVDLQKQAKRTTNDISANAEALAHFQAGMEALAKGQPDAITYLQQASAAAPDNLSFIRAVAGEQLRSAVASDVSAAASTVRRLVETARKENTPLTIEDYALMTRAYCKSADPAGAAASLLRAPPSDIAAISASTELRTSILRDCHVPQIQLVFQSAPKDTAAFKITKVFIHISDRADQSKAEALRQALAKQGFSVPGIELVPTGYPRAGQLRYYYEVQRPQAEEIVQRANEALAAGTGAAASMPPLTLRSIESLYQGLPQDRVEIWLAPHTP